MEVYTPIPSSHWLRATPVGKPSKEEEFLAGGSHLRVMELYGLRVLANH